MESERDETKIEHNESSEESAYLLSYNKTPQMALVVLVAIIISSPFFLLSFTIEEEFGWISVALVIVGAAIIIFAISFVGGIFVAIEISEDTVHIRSEKKKVLYPELPLDIPMSRIRSLSGGIRNHSSSNTERFLKLRIHDQVFAIKLFDVNGGMQPFHDDLKNRLSGQID